MPCCAARPQPRSARPRYLTAKVAAGAAHAAATGAYSQREQRKVSDHASDDVSGSGLLRVCTLPTHRFNGVSCVPVQHAHPGGHSRLSRPRPTHRRLDSDDSQWMQDFANPMIKKSPVRPRRARTHTHSLTHTHTHTHTHARTHSLSATTHLHTLCRAACLAAHQLVVLAGRGLRMRQAAVDYGVCNTRSQCGAGARHAKAHHGAILHVLGQQSDVH